MAKTWGSNLVADFRARKNELEGRRMQPVTEHEGQQELWFEISFSIAGHDDIPLPFKGVNAEDARQAFMHWLEQAEVPGIKTPWRTISITLDGAQRELTFRTDWVSGFTINPKGGSLRV